MTLFLTLLMVSSVLAKPLDDAELQAYFAGKVAAISSHGLPDIKTREQWEALKPKYRRELLEMFGLDPLPQKTDLHPVVTGIVEREDFLVEKLQFQSLPGLYVTANLYRPKVVKEPLPAILYVCGHGPVKIEGVSYGNKVAYQHHGAWFARNGYVCLTIDTIQLGEIEGIHHGTYREGMWWWNSRGYTPAGVEAWNCVRALDYLETRPEVDKARFGVTGRSGGGAYSWWITALDDRVKVAAPVAGITDLRNHVVDGVVEGHCDCMFFVNTYRWDYPLVAALAAPRPLLLCNSDNDSIFPLDGVLRTHAAAKRIYDLYGASGDLGLVITPGPHKDTQDLQMPVFRWFNKHLKGIDPIIDMAAKPFFTPQELKVLPEIPADERTSRIHETFVPQTPVADFAALRQTLRQETFGAWPMKAPEVRAYDKSSFENRGNAVFRMKIDSEPHIALTVYEVPGRDASRVRLLVLDEEDQPMVEQAIRAHVGLEDAGSGQAEREEKRFRWIRSILGDHDRALEIVLVRGLPGTSTNAKTQVRRRYMLIGTTVDAMRVWDISAAVQLLRSRTETENTRLEIIASGSNAANALMYATMAENPPERLTLLDFPVEEIDQPDYLNYRRFTTLEELIERLPRERKVAVERRSSEP